MKFLKLTPDSFTDACNLIESVFGKDQREAFEAEAEIREGQGIYIVVDYVKSLNAKQDEPQETIQVVAVGAFDYSPMDDNTVEAYFVAVHSAYQNKGYGRFLMESMIAENVTGKGIEMILCTCKKNLIPMYTKLGFTVAYELKNDRVLMGCKTNE